jgi:hypothetical protein
VLRDVNGRELFDLPKAPLPDEDEEAPVRYLPDYDSVLLAHADRSRIVHADHRRKLFLRNLVIPSSFLVDGLVAGLWRVENKGTAHKRRVRLVLKPFHKLNKRTRTLLNEEGERLLRFIEPDAESYTV